MIHLTRINHLALILNADLIEHIESTPDTVISLTTGQKLIVLETPAEIIEKVVRFRRSILSGPFPGSRLRSLPFEQPGYGDQDPDLFDGVR